MSRGLSVGYIEFLKSAENKLSHIRDVGDQHTNEQIKRKKQKILTEIRNAKEKASDVGANFKSGEFVIDNDRKISDIVSTIDSEITQLEKEYNQAHSSEEVKENVALETELYAVNVMQEKEDAEITATQMTNDVSALLPRITTHRTYMANFKNILETFLATVTTHVNDCKRYKDEIKELADNLANYDEKGLDAAIDNALNNGGMLGLLNAPSGSAALLNEIENTRARDLQQWTVRRNQPAETKNIYIARMILINRVANRSAELVARGADVNATYINNQIQELKNAAQIDHNEIKDPLIREIDQKIAELTTLQQEASALHGQLNTARRQVQQLKQHLADIKTEEKKANDCHGIIQVQVDTYNTMAAEIKNYMDTFQVANDQKIPTSITLLIADIKNTIQASQQYQNAHNAYQIAKTAAIDPNNQQAVAALQQATADLEAVDKIDIDGKFPDPHPDQKKLRDYLNALNDIKNNVINAFTTMGTPHITAPDIKTNLSHLNTNAAAIKTSIENEAQQILQNIHDVYGRISNNKIPLVGDKPEDHTIFDNSSVGASILFITQFINDRVTAINDYNQQANVIARSDALHAVANAIPAGAANNQQGQQQQQAPVANAIPAGDAAAANQQQQVPVNQQAQAVPAGAAAAANQQAPQTQTQIEDTLRLIDRTINNRTINRIGRNYTNIRATLSNIIINNDVNDLKSYVDKNIDVRNAIYPNYPGTQDLKDNRDKVNRILQTYGNNSDALYQIYKNNLAYYKNIEENKKGPFEIYHKTIRNRIMKKLIENNDLDHAYAVAIMTKHIYMPIAGQRPTQGGFEYSSTYFSPKFVFTSLFVGAIIILIICVIYKIWCASSYTYDDYDDYYDYSYSDMCCSPLNVKQYACAN